MLRTGTARHRAALGWRLALYMVIILMPAVLTVVLEDLSYIGPYLAAARMSALLAFAILALQPVLSARFRWIETVVGLDRLITFHRYTGLAAVLLAMAHPVMLGLAYRSWRLLTDPSMPWEWTMGRLALLILLAYAAGAVFHGLLRLPFQWWLRMHNAFAPVILAAGFVHSWFIHIGGAHPAIRAAWLSLLAAGTFSYLHLTVYQRMRSRLRPYAVTDVTRVARKVWGIRLEPPRGRGFRHLPGQFLFVKLMRGRGLPVEEHPFTIASEPKSDLSLEIAPKELGDFTATLGETRPGDRAAVMGPYGRFSHLLRPECGRLVLLAGGIGITPMISMLRHMSRQGERRDVLLLYGNRTAEDIAFGDELEAMEQSSSDPALRVVHVLSAPKEGWTGETGYIDRRLLSREITEMRDAAFYVCGPPAMMRSVTRTLRSMGVGKDRINTEYFSL